jgi:hypothetical protein
MKKLFILMMLLFLLLLSCREIQVEIGNFIDKIVVITEGNNCGVCNKKFAEATIENLQGKNTIFLITSTGNDIDIKPFLNLEKNCFFDWELNISQYPEFESCKIIYLKNNEIDTVIVIQSELLFEQLEYIEHRK